VRIYIKTNCSNLQPLLLSRVATGPRDSASRGPWTPGSSQVATGDLFVVFSVRSSWADRASGNQIIIIIVIIIIHIIIVDLCSVEETSSQAIIYIFSVVNTHLIIVITTLSFYYLHSVSL